MSPEGIEQFKEICREELGLELSDEQAAISAQRVLTFLYCKSVIDNSDPEVFWKR